MTTQQQEQEETSMMQAALAASASAHTVRRNAPRPNTELVFLERTAAEPVRPPVSVLAMLILQQCVQHGTIRFIEVLQRDLCPLY
jgi:hypothetical protein